VRERAVAAYPSTVYRLDETGEVHEVIVEEADIVTLQYESSPVVAMWPEVEQRPQGDSFDEVAWWSRQLGKPFRKR
jgi:hypothetical protein